MKLPESAATGSSMMPHKLNPDVAELARAKAGTALGRLTGLLAVVKGLPLSYNRDLQEDKPPVFAARHDVIATAEALAALVRELTFEHARLEEAAADPLLRAAERRPSSSSPKDAVPATRTSRSRQTCVKGRSCRPPMLGRRSRRGPRTYATRSQPQNAASARRVRSLGWISCCTACANASRPLVPRQLRVAANRAVFSGVGLALRGDAVRCPCCGSYRRFPRYPTEYCPACGSYERQRLLCLYLDRNPALVSGDVLPPARSGRSRTATGRARRWLAVDVDPDHPLADETMDVRSLALPDEAFDFVLCSHVLDILEEHDRAVGELYRVTRPGGIVLIQAPAVGEGDARRLRPAAGGSRLPRQA